jgi:hypothetical protein
VKATLLVWLALVLVAACKEYREQLNHGPLDTDRAAVAVHVPCLDLNRDHVLGQGDAGRPLAGGAEVASGLPDFDADGQITGADSAFLSGLSMLLDPAIDLNACDGDTPVDFLVGSASEPAIDCASGRPAAIIVGVAGGIANLKKSDDGAGIRYIANGLLQRLDGEGYQTLGVIAGPAVPGLAPELHAGMETWLTHTITAYLDAFPCAQAILIGHSHGAVTTDVLGARLEDQYADRIPLVVRLDRIDDLYFGDTASMPQQLTVFNIFETNDDVARGEAFAFVNVENFDASGETGPEDGEEGGDQKPVLHSTIDNSESVRDVIIERALASLR